MLNQQLENSDVPLLHGEKQWNIAKLVCLIDVGASIDVEFNADHFVVPRENMNAVHGRLHRRPGLE